MFFCPELLLKRGHPFFVVWIAATQKGARLNRYLTSRKAAKLNIHHVIKEVLKRVIVTSAMPRELAMRNGCFSLYLSAQLMYGCCVALERKATILINDLGSISRNLRKMRFSSEKFQMVLEVPKKYGKNATNPVGLSERQPCDFSILGILLDDSEATLEFTHSVPERSITLEEILFIPPEEDTRFGDEGDGGRGFINFLNGELPEQDPLEANYDQQPAGLFEDFQTSAIRTSYPVPVSGVHSALNDSAPNGPLEEEQSSEVPPVQKQQHPTPAVLEQHAISSRISEAQLDEISSVMQLPDLEQQDNADRPKDHSEEIFPNILPLPAQQESVDEISKSPAQDIIHIQPTLFQEESNMMELPELNEIPEVGRKRKRHPITDNTIMIPPSLIRRRIDTGATDTLRKESSYEDSILMLLTAKWLNLNAMREPGRRVSGPLAALFSRHCITRPVPNDDSDIDLNRTVDQPDRIETPHAQSSFPVNLDSSFLEGRKQNETPGTPIVSPTFENVLQKLSTPPREGEIFNSLNELFTVGTTPYGLEEERRESMPKDSAGKPESTKRSRGKVQSSDNLQLPSPKRQRTTETVVEMPANKEHPALVGAAVEPNKSAEDFQHEETRIQVDIDAQDIPACIDFIDDIPVRKSLENQETGMITDADVTGIQDIPNPVDPIDTLSLLGQETFTALNPEEGTFIEDTVKDQIQSEGVKDQNLRDESRPSAPSRPRQNTGGDVGRASQDSVSNSSASSLGPSVLQNVLLSAVELAHGRNESTIPVADLCPPSTTSRRKAADFFGALLDLHMHKRVTLHQDKSEDIVGPISINVNE